MSLAFDPFTAGGISTTPDVITTDGQDAISGNAGNEDGGGTSTLAPVSLLNNYTLTANGLEGGISESGAALAADGGDAFSSDAGDANGADAFGSGPDETVIGGDGGVSISGPAVGGNGENGADGKNGADGADGADGEDA